YAVDFDGDGHIDLANSPADAIGSVARYLSAHGWRPGAPVAIPAKVSGDHYRTLLGDNVSVPKRTLKELEAFGVEATGDAADTLGDRPAKLLRLQGRDGPGYWITFHNFYVITRYNHSALYAMAVYQLGRAIRTARGRGGE
ncbi:MAG TPA: lytic murein transglycosylase, partial [Chromatiales bacterium]|nr:lytic murein transglycosylase [Chromatiales bacterium]